VCLNSRGGYKASGCGSREIALPSHPATREARAAIEAARAASLHQRCAGLLVNVISFIT
jgi:hypothetical protein